MIKFILATDNILLPCIYIIVKENEVDGDAFLLLSKFQIKQLVTAIGPQVKLIQKHKYLISSLPKKAMVTPNEHTETMFDGILGVYYTTGLSGSI